MRKHSKDEWKLIKECFLEHVLVKVHEIDARRAFIAIRRPKSSFYYCEILVTSFGVLVYGDIKTIFFQGGDGGPWRNTLAWAGGRSDGSVPDAQYLGSKASIGTGPEVQWDWSRKEAKADVLEWRRQKMIDRELARELYDMISEGQSEDALRDVLYEKDGPELAGGFGKVPSGRLMTAIAAVQRAWELVRNMPPSTEGHCSGRANAKCQTLELEKSYVYWGTGDEEELRYHDFDEAVEAHLDGFLGPRETEMRLPDELTLVEFEPMKVSESHRERIADRVCELIFEELDEEHGNPQDDSTTPDECEQEMALELVDTFVKYYHVWACDRTGRTRTIDVAAWILKNRPDWLEGDLESDEALRQWVRERT